MAPPRYLRALPPLTRLEWHLTRWPVLRHLINRFHQQRKKLGIHQQKARDRSVSRGLRNYEQKTFSQNGEDGVLAEIFQRIGEQGKFAVEFGIQDGTECCTRELFEARGWSGLLIEGSTKDAEAARQLFEGRPVRVLDRFITAETIVETFVEGGVPTEFDLLVVDIDGNDYPVLKAILAEYRPRVLCVEYNGRFVPPTEWVMPYDPTHVWDGSVYFGASLESFDRLARSHDYCLVGCEWRGSNAFFVRADQLGDHFPNSDRGTAYHYAVPQYAAGFGHPVRCGPK